MCHDIRCSFGHPLQPDVKPDVASGSEHINLKVTGSVSELESYTNQFVLTKSGRQYRTHSKWLLVRQAA